MGADGHVPQPAQIVQGIAGKGLRGQSSVHLAWSKASVQRQPLRHALVGRKERQAPSPSALSGQACQVGPWFIIRISTVRTDFRTRAELEGCYTIKQAKQLCNGFSGNSAQPDHP